MKWIRIFACILLTVVFLASLFLNVRHYHGANRQGIARDTVRFTIFDTIPYYKPIPKDSVVVRYITEKLPVSNSTGNNGEKNIPENGNIPSKNIPDSIMVEIPITQTVYGDSTYRAYVSGYRASLDSLIFYPQREIVTINNTYPKSKQKRWGIGIQVGYGISTNGTPQLSPYIGVGISYNIFSF